MGCHRGGRPLSPLQTQTPHQGAGGARTRIGTPRSEVAAPSARRSRVSSRAFSHRRGARCSGCPARRARHHRRANQRRRTQQTESPQCLWQRSRDFFKTCERQGGRGGQISRLFRLERTLASLHFPPSVGDATRRIGRHATRVHRSCRREWDSRPHRPTLCAPQHSSGCANRHCCRQCLQAIVAPQHRNRVCCAE